MYYYLFSKYLSIFFRLHVSLTKIGVVICVSTIGLLVAILGFVIYRSRPKKPKYCNTEETEGLIVMNMAYRSKEKLDDRKFIRSLSSYGKCFRYHPNSRV